VRCRLKRYGVVTLRKRKVNIGYLGVMPTPKDIWTRFRHSARAGSMSSRRGGDTSAAPTTRTSEMTGRTSSEDPFTLLRQREAASTWR
jgi:hypothetical protein